MTLDLQLQKGREVDPTYQANADPIVKWAKEVYVANPSKARRLEEAWRGAAAQVGLAKAPWRIASGPVGAVTATMKRIAWALASWRYAYTGQGEVIDFQRVTPAEVRRKVVETTSRAILAAVALALAIAADFAPLRREGGAEFEKRSLWRRLKRKSRVARSRLR